MNSLGPDFDTLLTRGALVALAAAVGWSLLVVVAVAVEARTGGAVSLAEHTGCPPALRWWLLGLFVALFAGMSPANASDAGSGAQGASTQTPVEAALDGLPLPDRVSGAIPSAAFVVVRPGDSLWHIACRLQPHATASEVAAAVTRLYAANRLTIGPDPDLLRPGQRLLVDRTDTRPEAP